MSWASHRRFVLIGCVLIIAIAIIAWIAYGALHTLPSCFDKKQNGTEEGVDCGGSCAYLCRASVTPPSVRFARPLRSPSGRTDMLAYIDNPNPNAAARNVSFSVELLNARGFAIASSTGVIDLPPLSTVPIFIPGLSVTGSSTQAFVTINQNSLHWFRSMDKQTLPRVADKIITATPTPRLTVTLTNDFPTALNDIKLIAAIFDADGNVIAASQTLVPRIGPSQSIPEVFTWSEAFKTDAARIDVLPVMSILGR